jgi:hypothetical protein
MNALTEILLPAPAEATEVSPRINATVRLYCGLSIPGGAVVGADAARAFIADHVSTSFPDGYTVISGQGGWRDCATGKTIAEDSLIIEVQVNWKAAKAKVLALANAWKTAFRQDAVMVTRQPVSVSFV